MNGSWTVSRFLWLRLFLLKAEEVSDRQRWRAKMINYLLTSGSSLLWYRMKQHRNKDRTICHSSNEIGSMFAVSDKKNQNARICYGQIFNHVLICIPICSREYFPIWERNAPRHHIHYYSNASKASKKFCKGHKPILLYLKYHPFSNERNLKLEMIFAQSFTLYHCNETQYPINS